MTLRRPLPRNRTLLLALMLPMWSVSMFFTKTALAHDDPHPNPGASSPPISTVSVKGQFTYSDGTPVSGKSAQFQWIIEGNELFAQGVGTCPATAAHMTGTKIQPITLGAQGEY